MKLNITNEQREVLSTELAGAWKRAMEELEDLRRQRRELSQRIYDLESSVNAIEDLREIMVRAVFKVDEEEQT